MATRPAGMSETGTSGGRVLAILLIAYIFNFIDRQIIGVLAVPIKAEFQLDDQTLSYLGIAFAFFYSALAIPISWLADRRSRVNIIAISVAVWSGFTAACGLVQNFAGLVLARMGVAVGEAGGIAPAYALISDFFPRERRARAMAIFSLGIPIGSGLGIFFGGWIATALDWRSAFIIVGLAGIPAALLVKFGIKDPVRGGFDNADGAASEPAPPLGIVAARLARTPSFWLLSFGAAVIFVTNLGGFGLIFWLPSFFNRSFGLKLFDLSLFYGTIVLVGGIAGTWLGGWIGDKAGSANPRAYALIPAICFTIAAPCFAFGLFAPSLPVAWLLFAVGQMLALAWLGPVISAVQHIVPPNMRATASASFLFINNLIGIGVGTWLLGFMSDRMTAAHGADSLQYSILYGLGFYLLSASIYFVASTRLRRDWYRA